MCCYYLVRLTPAAMLWSAKWCVWECVVFDSWRHSVCDDDRSIWCCWSSLLLDQVRHGVVCLKWVMHCILHALITNHTESNWSQWVSHIESLRIMLQSTGTQHHNEIDNIDIDIGWWCDIECILGQFDWFATWLSHARQCTGMFSVVCVNCVWWYDVLCARLMMLCCHCGLNDHQWHSCEKWVCECRVVVIISIMRVCRCVQHSSQSTCRHICISDSTWYLITSNKCVLCLCFDVLTSASQDTAALRADNLFYHLTYEDVINVDVIHDAVEWCEIETLLVFLINTEISIVVVDHMQHTTVEAGTERSGALCGVRSAMWIQLKLCVKWNCFASFNLQCPCCDHHLDK